MFTSIMLCLQSHMLEYLLCGQRFPVRLKGAVYKSYALSAILYRTEVWCLNENRLGIL